MPIKDLATGPLLHSGRDSMALALLHSGAISSEKEKCYTVLQEDFPGPFSDIARHCVTRDEVLESSNQKSFFGQATRESESHCVTNETGQPFLADARHCVTGPDNEGVIADKALFRLARRWKGRGVSVNDPRLPELFDEWLASRQGADLKSSLRFLGDSRRVFGIFQAKWCSVKKPTSEDAHERSWASSEKSEDSFRLASIKSDFVRRIGRWMRDLQEIVGQGETIWLSTPTIIDKMGGDRMSAWRCLNQLESLGFIRRKRKNQKPSPHRATEYIYVEENKNEPVS